MRAVLLLCGTHPPVVCHYTPMDRHTHMNYVRALPVHMEQNYVIVPISGQELPPFHLSSASSQLRYFRGANGFLGGALSLFAEVICLDPQWGPIFKP